MNKDGLVVGEISDCFPTNEELRKLFLEKFIQIDSDSFTLETDREKEIFAFGVRYTKQIVLDSASQKLYPDPGYPQGESKKDKI